MKKLFFFKSSSGNCNDKQTRRGKESEATPKGVAIKSQSGQALRRSHSFSSAAFLLDGTSSNDPTATRQRNHQSSRCFTPESQCKKPDQTHKYKVHDSSGTLSTCSSNVSSQVLDRFIDGEEHHHIKQKSGSSLSNHSCSTIRAKKHPPRAQIHSPTISDIVKERRHSDNNRINDASARSLARSVMERLSHTHGKSKALSYGSQDLDVFANLLPLAEHIKNGYYKDDHVEEEEVFSHGKNSELEKKYKEAEKRVKMLSQELNEEKCDFEERVGLAFEVLSLLRSQIDERALAKEEIKRVKTDAELHIKRLEKEKSELEFGLEKEIDRRSIEWSSKLESFQIEEKRLRERVRELAEHNVSLQREVSTFHEKETERMDMIREMDEKVNELSEREEETRQENVYLMQNLSKLQESYGEAREDLDCVRRMFEEKDKECKELNKSVTRLVRTCREQEKTIQGLRDGFSEKQPLEKFQTEQIRLSGVEFSLRKELESMKLEAETLRIENTCLRSRVKGQEGDAMATLKLDNEMKMRVCLLQDQGVSMLSESMQVCYKLLKFIKEKVSQDMRDGMSEQFLIESEMNVHGIRRGTEDLKRSLQTVTSLLLEKGNEIASNSESPDRPSEPNNQSVEKLLRAELKAESLITCLLREKLYSKEQEIEQLHAEVAVGVRGNEVLRGEIQNVLDNLSVNTHQLKDLKLQIVKKDETVNRLETNLQEAAKQFASMKVNLPRVMEEREQMCKEVNECRKRNMELESDKEMLKKEVERLEEETLYKEGQITILKDTLGSKHFDLLSGTDFSYNDFLVQQD
ncbi:interaptin isoform X2 [Brassica rapa]|uniref:interaptin isoform X2 n=1 Tax=Brassica campestris TaxID=3711 RepID=UPI00142D3D4C|nr:interaptin isoform X2 [Brassica rapa]XP_033148759.1 interaptin isoform X2 [Brassica rapa]